MEMLERIDAESFRINLLKWWQQNRRDYPWRKTREPYDILIAEILLHRTRADQVVPVYDQFLEKFPSASKLAKASIEEIGSVMQSLGLHWRVELLYRMALELDAGYKGRIPYEREELESLPGISHYIASAIRCFAYGYPDALLDTNTVRICGRLLDIPVTDGSRRSRKFRNILEVLIDPEQPREFNFALLDHGALVCRSRTPMCPECPVIKYCCYGRRLLEQKL